MATDDHTLKIILTHNDKIYFIIYEFTTIHRPLYKNLT